MTKAQMIEQSASNANTLAQMRRDGLRHTEAFVKLWHKAMALEMKILHV